MTEEQHFDPLNEEISKLDSLRAKLEELVSKRDPSPEPDKTSFASTASNSLLEQSEKNAFALSTKMDSRIKAIESALGELQSRMDDSVFNAFADSFKAKMHVMEQRLNIDEKIKTIRKEVGTASAEVISGIEQKINSKVNALESKLGILGDQNKKIMTALEVGIEARLNESEKNSKELLIRTKDLIATLQKRLETEIENMRRDYDSSANRSDDKLKNFEGQFNQRLGIFEKNLDEVTNHSIASVAKLEGEMESRINQIENKNRELISKSWEPIAAVEEKLSAELRQLKQEFDLSQAKGKEQAQSDEVKLDIKLARLERQVEEFTNQTIQTISKVQGEFDSKFNQFESRNKELVSKTLDAMSIYEGRLAQEITRVRHEFVDEQAKHADQLRNFEADIKLKAKNLEEKWAAFTTQLESLENGYREFLTTARSNFSDFEGRVNHEVSGLRDTVEGFIPRVGESIRMAQGELSARVTYLESKMNSQINTVHEVSASLQGEMESKINQLESKYKEIISRTAQSVAGLQVSIETDLARMHDQLKEVTIKTAQAEDFVRNETREKILSETAWQQLTNRMSTAVNDLDVKMRQSMMDIEKAQKTVLERKLTRSLIGFFILAAVISVLMYLGVVGQANGFLKSIHDTFSSDKGKNAIINAAIARVPEVLQENAKPVMDLIKQDATKRITEFQGYLDQQKNRISDDQLMMSSELVFLEERNRLTQLEDEAIHRGNRKAFDDLLNYIDVASQPQLAQTAQASIERIKSFYAGDSRVQKYTLTFQGPSNFVYQDDSIPVTALFTFIRNGEDWKDRAKAADLLRYWKKQGVPEVLLEAAGNDTNLDVVKSALRSFEAVTGYKLTHALDYQSAKTWWDQNKQTIYQQLSVN